MKVLLFGVLYILVTIAALCYGFALGRDVQTTTYESDLKACINVCEPNGGVEHISTSVLCSCENGGLFGGEDIRD